MPVELPSSWNAVLLIVAFLLLPHIYRTIRAYYSRNRALRSKKQGEQAIAAYLKTHFDR